MIKFDPHNVLIGKIKMCLAAATRAAAEADEHWTRAGKLLKELKAEKPKGVTWVVYVRDHFALSQQRADELIRIADGDTTIDKVRARNNESKKRHREKTQHSGNIGGAKEKSEARAKADQAKAEAATARSAAAEAKANAAKAKADARAEKDRLKARMWEAMAGYRTAPKSIHSSDRELLVKALGMLGSDQPGERDNAACAAEKIRRRLSMTWDELIIKAGAAKPATHSNAPQHGAQYAHAGAA